MKKEEVTILNRAGMHARPAALIAQAASDGQSDVMLSLTDENNQEEKANAKSIMGIIALGAGYKAKLTLTVEGPDEEQVFNKIKALFENKFEEE